MHTLSHVSGRLLHIFYVCRLPRITRGLHVNNCQCLQGRGKVAKHQVPTYFLIQDSGAPASSDKMDMPKRASPNTNSQEAAMLVCVPMIIHMDPKQIKIKE